MTSVFGYNANLPWFLIKISVSEWIKFILLFWKAMMVNVSFLDYVLRQTLNFLNSVTSLDSEINRRDKIFPTISFWYYFVYFSFIWTSSFKSLRTYNSPESVVMNISSSFWTSDPNRHCFWDFYKNMYVCWPGFTLCVNDDGSTYGTISNEYNAGTYNGYTEIYIGWYLPSSLVKLYD